MEMSLPIQLWVNRKAWNCETGIELKSNPSKSERDWRIYDVFMYVCVCVTITWTRTHSSLTYINNLKPPLNNNHHKYATFIYLCVCDFFVWLVDNFLSLSLIFPPTEWCPIQHKWELTIWWATWATLLLCGNKCVNFRITCRK